MGGLGLGAWLFGRVADRHAKPAALSGWLEIAVGLFGIVSPVALALARRAYVATAGALAFSGAASVALRFSLAALVLLIPTILMGGTLPALTRAFMGLERDRLGPSLSRLYGLNTVVGASTYAFSLVLLVFLLGTGLGSALLAWRSPSFAPLADAGLAQGITAAGAASLLVFFSALPLYVIAVFQHTGFDATTRLLLLGVAVGGAILIPAVGMGLSFPLLTDLVAPRDAARGADVGSAYAVNTLGSIAGAVLTGFVFVGVLGTKTTLRLGVVINGAAALVLAALAARGVPEGSAAHRAFQLRVLAAGALASAALGVAIGAPARSTRLIDIAPTIYAREPLSAAGRPAPLSPRAPR